jgi:glycosyltransferase involved in cell wall biosynthesis
MAKRGRAMVKHCQSIMKIGIDARMFGPKQGGLGRYIEQLIINLEKIDRANEYVIFLRKNNWAEYSPAAPNFIKVLADIPWYGWAEQVKMPGIIKHEKIELMHFPHWNVPFFFNAPYIVTIHDLLLLHYPTRKASTLGTVAYWFKNLAYKIVLRHAVQKARAIITPSEFTKKDVMSTFNQPAEKIVTTHLAPYNNDAAKDGRASAIPEPYVLYVGVAYPHKNLDRLLLAWNIFTEKYGNKYRLILSGKHNYFYKKLMESAKSDSIIFTDFLSDADLSVVYDHASLFIFPSLYEGFGMPPLEAMAHGVPVISSRSTCLREILGDAAYYFDPEQPAEIAGAIQTVLTDQNIRNNLLEKAKNVLARYSWEETARQTLNIYLSTGQK